MFGVTDSKMPLTCCVRQLLFSHTVTCLHEFILHTLLLVPTRERNHPRIPLSHPSLMPDPGALALILWLCSAQCVPTCTANTSHLPGETTPAALVWSNRRGTPLPRAASCTPSSPTSPPSQCPSTARSSSPPCSAPPTSTPHS